MLGAVGGAFKGAYQGFRNAQYNPLLGAVGGAFKGAYQGWNNNPSYNYGKSDIVQVINAAKQINNVIASMRDKTAKRQAQVALKGFLEKLGKISSHTSQQRDYEDIWNDPEQGLFDPNNPNPDHRAYGAFRRGEL